MCAVLIIAAFAFGAEFGFISGALSMLISNFIYGQGMWTPFQMMGMGITVFLCAVIIKTFKIKNRIIIGVISGVLCFFVYGIIVDLGSVFMMVSEFNLKSVLAVYSAGIPFNTVHSISTAVIVALIQPPVTEKLERIKIKYGIFAEGERGIFFFRRPFLPFPFLFGFFPLFSGVGYRFFLHDSVFPRNGTSTERRISRRIFSAVCLCSFASCFSMSRCATVGTKTAATSSGVT